MDSHKETPLNPFDQHNTLSYDASKEEARSMLRLALPGIRI